MVKQRKVLVADDDRVTREIIGAMLTRAGHEVVFAEDGKLAVEKASTEKPDIVFIDGLMPKMHGFLACKAIKELDTPPKVILLTGIYTKPNYKWEAKGTFGADDLLRKPSSPEELLACIEKHLPSETDYLDAQCEIQTQEHDQAIAGSCDSVADPLPASLVLDHSLLLLFVDGDEDLLRSICGLFLGSYPGLLSKIRDAIARADADELARAAHTLKGSGGHFLAASAVRTLVDLELIAHGGDLNNAPERLAELEWEMERLRPELLILSGEGAQSPQG